MVDQSSISGGSGRFSTTHWSMLEVARGPIPTEHWEVLNCLILRYWRPVYVYVCRRGFRNDAADLTQDFFVNTLRRELFGRADPARGRFRTFFAGSRRKSRPNTPLLSGVFAFSGFGFARFFVAVFARCFTSFYLAVSTFGSVLGSYRTG